MSVFQEFNCPTCGDTNLYDSDEVGDSGVWLLCRNCGGQVFVGKGGGVAAGEAAPLEEPVEGGLGTLLKMPSGKVERLSAEAVDHGIQSRRILPWDLVSDDGQEFRPILEHEDFQKLFGPSDFTVAVRPYCVNHPEAVSAGTCRKCGRGYCEGCLSKPSVCPACGGAIKEPDPRLRERPPWQRPREVALFPIEGDGWKMTLGLGVVLWLASRSLLASPLYLIALAALVYVLDRSSKGDKVLAMPQDLDYQALFRRLLPIGVLSLVAFVPLIVVGSLFDAITGVLLQFPLTLFILAYYPMAVGVAFLESDPQKALSPVSVGKAMWALKEDYILCVLLLVAVTVFVVAVQVFLSFFGGVGNLLGSFAQAYGAILQTHLLGWLLYMNRERIVAAVS